MNAINFIKQHGVDKAREVVDNHHECYMPEVFKYWSEQLQDYVLAPKYASFLVSDLKRLVESVEVINKFDSVQEAKDALCHHHWVDGLDGGTMVCARKCGAWK